jgi:hypothetical protein
VPAEDGTPEQKQQKSLGDVEQRKAQLQVRQKPTHLAGKE